MDLQTRVSLALAASAGLALHACELEECDPLIDPLCVPAADAGFDAPRDSGGDATSDVSGADTSGCGALGEGQSRCLSGSVMQQCLGGSLRDTTCDGDCVGMACQEAIRYVRIIDLTPDLSGQHPGADIDAVSLQSGGETFYAEAVTDWFIDTSIANRAPDVNEALGPPDQGGATCDLTDGAEHWVSLAGGELVVRFDGSRPLRTGDRVTIFECSGAAQDRFDITIGTTERLEGDWTTVLEEASGTITVTIP